MSVVKCGFSFLMGVYVGTYFDCKPHIKQIEEFIRDNIPRKK
jgi:hypothetical protein